MKALIPAEMIERKIYLIRRHRVMLDNDLAELYGVETKRLNDRFAETLNYFRIDFMFQLTAEESESLRSHFATLKSGRAVCYNCSSRNAGDVS